MGQDDHSVLDALKRRVARAESHAHLRQLASELGHAMAAGHLDARSTHALSRAVARARRDREPRDDGYLTALSDLMAAFAAGRADADDRATSTRALEDAPPLRRLALALYERPQGPSALATVLGIPSNDGRVTRYLQKLEALGLVEPARSADGRERLRQLTSRGNRIAAGLRAAEPAASPASADAVTAAAIVAVVVGMVHLVSRCRDVSIAELAASAGLPDESGEALARRFALLSERRGLVDVTPDDRCVWGREGSEWRAVLESYSHRPQDLRAAFAPVPSGFVIGTDEAEVDAWREALRDAGVVGVQDVGSYFFVTEMIQPGEASAIVSTDETAARGMAGDNATPVYCASRRRNDIVVTPVAA